MVTAKPITLTATVGAQPQVVTFALDTLLAQKIPISELIVLYLSPPNRRTQHALQKLEHEIKGEYGQFGRLSASHILKYQPYPIRPVANIQIDMTYVCMVTAVGGNKSEEVLNISRR